MEIGFFAGVGVVPSKEKEDNDGFPGVAPACSCLGAGVALPNEKEGLPGVLGGVITAGKVEGDCLGDEHDTLLPPTTGVVVSVVAPADHFPRLALPPTTASTFSFSPSEFMARQTHSSVRSNSWSLLRFNGIRPFPNRRADWRDVDVVPIRARRLRLRREAAPTSSSRLRFALTLNFARVDVVALAGLDVEGAFVKANGCC
mmetsp:Transcript_5183/g.11446  ORF Transcript_5183/g.11446 Transcript_5183/m.11446 type:complete len:201 (-) Transcript_5183:1976-2578(-)